MSMNYSISQAEPGEVRHSVLDLWKRNLPTASGDRHAWLYEDGPASEWLLETEDGTTVGAAGLMHRQMVIGDELVRVGQAIDLNVDRDHRSAGPALKLGRTVAATVARHELGLIYAFPDSNSELLLRRVGYKELGDFQRWAKPLKSRERLRRWLAYSLVRNAAAAVTDCFLWLTSAETYYRRPTGILVNIADRFDDRFDTLWQVAADRFWVMGQRTSDYLNWRFRRSPDACHRVFCVSNSDDELLAYLVYSVSNRTVHVADFLFAELENLEVLLAEFLRFCRQQQAEAVITSYLGSDEVCRKLKRFGFWKRPGKWKTMIYLDRDHFQCDPSQLLDHQNWFLTRADVDTDD